MITFSKLGGAGRLGNQLFQYAALKSVALKGGYSVKIPPPSMMEWHGQACLLSEFNIDCDFLKPSDLGSIKFSYSEPDHIEYDPDFWSIADDTDLYGFFQSLLYFGKFSGQIKTELSPRAPWKEEACEIIAQLKRDNPDYEIVSLHMRRGDNTDGSDEVPLYVDMYGTNNEFSWDSPYGSYLRLALDKFKNKKVKFLIFTGGSKGTDDNSSDIEWCQKFFNQGEFLFSPKSSTMLDFALIMNCDHNIMSHVSSFGWWAAYLNPNADKIVVAPYNYHYNHPSCHHREGFYPQTHVLV